MLIGLNREGKGYDAVTFYSCESCALALNWGGVSTDADRHRGYVSADLCSNLGNLDVQADYEMRRGSRSEDWAAVTGNAITCFTLTSGALKPAIRDLGGKAAVSVGLDGSETAGDVPDRLNHRGRYSVVVGNQKVGSFDPGHTATLVLQARIVLATETHCVCNNPEHQSPDAPMFQNCR